MASPLTRIRSRLLAGILSVGLAAGLLAAAPSASFAEIIDPEPDFGTSSISGTVTDADSGEPIAGVRIDVLDDNQESTGFEFTADDGTYSIIGIPEGIFSVGAFDGSNTYATQIQSGIVFTAGETSVVDFALELPTVASISGVVSLDGTPVEGITVTVYDIDGNFLREVVTDSAGVYSAGDIVSQTVFVTAGGFESGYQYVQSDYVDLALGDAVFDIALALIPTGDGAISGRVTDRDTGMPIEDAEIRLTADGLLEGPRFVRTDADGFYSFDNLPLGSYDVDASVYTDEWIFLYEYAVYSLLVTEESPVRTRDFALVPIPTGDETLNGVVRDTNDEPVAGAFLTLSLVNSQSQYSATSNEAGEYEFTQLPAGAYVLGVAPPENDDFTTDYFLPDTFDPSVQIVAGEPNTRDILLELFRTGMSGIQGLVLDAPAGEPIADMQVSVFSYEPGVAIRYVTTDENGEWRVDGLPPGTYGYSLSYQGESSDLEFWDESPVVLLDDLETESVVDRIERVAPGTGSVSVRIRDDATYVGIEGIQAFVSREGGGAFVGDLVTDATGSFVVENLPDGRYTLEAFREDYIYTGAVFLIEDGSAETLSITMRARPPMASGEGIVSVAVTDADGEPASRARVQLYETGVSLSAFSAFVEADADGMATIAGVPNGRYTLTVEYTPIFGSMQRAADQQLTLDDRQSTLDLQAQTTAVAAIGGTVDLSAMPIGERAVVQVLARNAETFALTGSDYVDPVTGRFQVEFLPAGSYILQFQQESYGPGQTFSFAPSYYTARNPLGVTSPAEAGSVTVVPGQVIRDIEHTLSVGSTITGTVRMQTSSEPIELTNGRAVEVRPYRLVDGEWVRVADTADVATVTNRGQFTLRGLEPGAYRIEFSDTAVGTRAFTTQYSGGAATLDTATTIVVAAGDVATGNDVVMSLREPGATPPSIVLDELGETLSALENQIGVGGSPTEGDSTELSVGEEFAGEWVSAWANSTPTQLGDWVQVSATGTIPVTLPVGLVGEHRLAVQDADGRVVGWRSVTIASADDVVEEPSDGETGGGGDNGGGGDTGNNSGGDGSGTPAPGSPEPGAADPTSRTPAVDTTSPTAGSPVSPVDAPAPNEPSDDAEGGDDSAGGGSDDRDGGGSANGGSDDNAAPPTATDAEGSAGVSPVLVASLIALVIAALIVAGVIIARRRAA